MTRSEALAAAHRAAALCIRQHIESSIGFADDWNDSEEIRLALEEVELRHIQAAGRLQTAAERELELA